MSDQDFSTESRPQILDATVSSNTPLCREHFRITLAVAEFEPAQPGQFIQLTPPAANQQSDDKLRGVQPSTVPLLPRAFSIGGLRRSSGGVEVDIIYRLVGIGTRWLASLTAGKPITVLGPLGRPFPISPTKPLAALVIGGVGMPPLRWMGEALRDAGKETLGFLGSQTADLIPLDRSGRTAPDQTATKAERCAAEFEAVDVPLVVSTDDGSCGFKGNVVQAMAAYFDANPVDADQLVVYTCGPERMMQAAADYCLTRGIECQVCMERPMACGVGTCQSCIVTVKSDRHETGWRYALCCKDGPVFDARELVWS